jgi:hypothetical protein
LTSLIAWIASDSHGPSSLNIATDSRISWPKPSHNVPNYYWDQGKKVFACKNEPVIIGFVGDVLFPALILPSLIDRIDRGVIRVEGIEAGILSALHSGWKDYPYQEQRGTTFYLAYRDNTGMKAQFHLVSFSVSISNKNGANWTSRDYAIPEKSAYLDIAGSGRESIKESISIWQSSSDAGTSRAIFCGFVDAILSKKDPFSGGSPQLGSLYRIGTGNILGIIHKGKRYFSGVRLIGDENVDSVEWRNSKFERTDGKTKKLLTGAQPQPRPEEIPAPTSGII